MQQPGYAAFTQCQDLYSAGGVTAPLYQWDHSAGTAAAVGGAFTGANGYSSAYQNAYFFGDYAVNRISALKLDASNNIIPGSLLTFTTAGDGPVEIEIGPEGDVYYLAINANEIRRIHFVGDNRPPIAGGDRVTAVRPDAAHRELQRHRIERSRCRPGDHLRLGLRRRQRPRDRR